MRRHSPPHNRLWKIVLSLTLAGLALCAFAGGASAAAGDLHPQRLADINPTGSSNPSGMATYNGNSYFAADDGVHGSELWKTDGNNATMVADISASGGSFPEYFEVANGWLYFRAYDDVYGTQVWKTNGDPLGPFGTQRVTSLNVANGGANPRLLTNSGGVIFFSATDGSGATEHGQEIWRTDGFLTSLVEDIDPGPASSNPQSMIDVNGTLYLDADDGTFGRELHKAAASGITGAPLVADINFGAADSYPLAFVNFDGDLYFSAETAAYGRELWRTNSGGTNIVADINPGAADSDIDEPTVMDHWLYFEADDGVNGSRLWRSNGGALGAGTDIFDPTSGGARELGTHGGALYFNGFGPAGQEPWVTHGVPGDTQPLADIYPGANNSFPDEFTGVGANVFFSARDATHGYEIWRTTGSGASMLDEINPSGDADPRQLTEFNGTLLFTAKDSAGDKELYTLAVEQAPPTPASGSNTPTPGVAGGITGRRAAALKKCKRKKIAAARKKCKKKARLLPV